MVIACPGVGDVAVENDEVTRAGGLTASKDFILSLINFLSLSLHIWDFSNVVSLYFIIITLIIDIIIWLLVLFCRSLFLWM